MDVAALGLSVDSSQVDKGTLSLDKLSSAAKRAQSAATGLASGGKAASAASDAVAGSANRAASALNVEAAAAAKAANAMQVHGKAVNDNARRMGGSMSGLAAQFQDIGVTAAMGMNPALIALQQGTQIAGQMEMAMQGGATATSVFGAAFKSLLSPVTLVSIVLTALVAAGLQMVDWAALAASALNALAGVLQTIAPYAALAAGGLALIYAPAIIGGVVSLIALLGRLAVSAGMAAAAMAAANPALALVAGITIAVAAANIFRDELAQIFGRDIVADAKNAVNFIIGAFVGGFNAIKASWSLLPSAIGDLVYQAANATIDAVEKMLNFIIEKIDAFIEKIEGVISTVSGWIGQDGVELKRIGEIKIPRPTNPYAGAAGAAADAAKGAFGSAMGTDYVGKGIEAVGTMASAASAKLKELAADLTTVDEKSKKKGGGGKTDREKFDDIVKDADAQIAALRAEQAGYGQTAEEAARLRYEQDLLNRATQAGLTLDPQQIALLKEKAATMASVEEATRRAKAQQDALNTAAGSFGGVLRGLLDGTTSWKDALLDLIPIVLKLLNDLNLASGGKGLFGGGWLQALLAGFFGFAKGGVFNGGNVVPFARGGVVSRPTLFPMAKGMGLMGEAGPEAIMPLRRGPDGRLGVSAANQNSQPLRLEIVSRFDADGGFESAVARTSQPIAVRAATQATGKLAKSVPAMVDNRNDEKQFRRLRPALGGA